MYIPSDLKSIGGAEVVIVGIDVVVVSHVFGTLVISNVVGSIFGLVF